ncbi:MAG TPA: asparagine synthase (glutamine-hydrolyzing) [Mycobacteriales bacterium]|nr:asparagine synthase (glutamine-hydrolyzing) [Mycobacteriales bacterium]
MCGIAGIFRPGGGELSDDLAGMITSIEHRGPDGHGSFVDDSIGIGHVRLAILDLTDSAAQPMRSADGRYVLSFNGEIYNYRELRRELEDRAITFRSTGDTQVLLEYIAAFGVETTLPRLEGDWAIALWDTRSRQLTLARDRYGVKPLYYRADPGREVRFGSELKALLGPGAAPEPAVLSAALLGLSTTWGRRTLFQGIQAVEPGESVTFGSDLAARHSRFFSFADLIDPYLFAELNQAPAKVVLDRLAEAFDRSLQIRLASDAPVGMLVSGGVDSSLIAATPASRGLSLFHADVAHDSEYPAASALAESLGSIIRRTAVSDADILDNIAAVTHFNEIPLIYHLNSVPFFCVSRLAGEHGMKVLLTGEGSDEFFIGYPQYALAPMLDRINGAKRRLQGSLYRYLPKATALLWQRDSDRHDTLLRSLIFGYEEEIVAGASRAPLDHLASPADRRAHQLSLTLAQEHLVSLLHRNDRLGMAWGIESRFPFLGHEFTELALNLPARYKLRWSRRAADRRHPFITDKWAVREIARARMPQNLAARAKRGFPVSIYDRIEVSERFFDGGFVADQYALDGRGLTELLARGSRLWITRLMLLEVWGQLFFGGRTVADLHDQLKAHIALAEHA